MNEIEQDRVQMRQIEQDRVGEIEQDQRPLAGPDWRSEIEDPETFLEPDQLVKERARPVPRARLTPRAAAGLWALRVLVVVLGAMVVYTFVAQLSS